jgi:replicative DNA helicase
MFAIVHTPKKDAAMTEPITDPVPLAVCEAAAVPADTPRLLPFADVVGAWAEDAQAARDAYTTGAPRGPLTGLPRLNEALGGCLAPGLHILHAEPGAGKTALALQVGTGCGCPCIFLTTEMAPLELAKRLTARLTETFLGRLKSGELLPEESLEHLRRAQEKASDFAFVDGTRAFADPATLREQVGVWSERCGARHLLLIVDSLHAWGRGAPWGEQTVYERTSRAVSELRGLAASLSVPLLAVSERNRGSMKGGGLSAGKGSSDIEYACESLWDLAVEKDTKEQPLPWDANGERGVTLRLEKNRNGSAGVRLPLRFHGALQMFRQM